MNPITVDPTRRALHGVAELLLAGPQYSQSGTIRLQVLSNGFGTRFEPAVRVVGAELVVADRRLTLDGRRIADIGELVGVEPSRPQVYEDGSGDTTTELLQVRPEMAARIADALALGDAALRQLVPGCDPVLWPEHFDVGIVHDGVAYGVSAGDSYLDEPYAYLSLSNPPAGDFFSAPFGAAVAIRELGAVDRVAGFLATGRALVAAGR